MRRTSQDEVECDFCAKIENQTHMMGQPIIKPGWFWVQYYSSSMNKKPMTILDFCQKDCIDKYDFNYV